MTVAAGDRFSISPVAFEVVAGPWRIGGRPRDLAC